jgi:hypothetical protein
VKLFGLRILQTLIGMSILGLALGCNREPDTHTVSGDIKARIPFTSEGGSYSLQEVGLSDISSLYELSGKYATFYIYPAISGNKLTGQQPKTRFIKAGDVYVPEDVLSQQLAVIYAHFQRLAILDKELGAEGVNTWPRDVGVAVRFRTPEGLQTDNAFYEATTDSMMVVPYTQENMPIAVNAGILAHEYFHSLYYKLVEKPVFKTPGIVHVGSHIVDDIELSKPTPDNSDADVTEYHEFFSRALNEGLADFWAWIYTGDPDFLQVSLPNEKKYRTLNLAAGELEELVFPTSQGWKSDIDNRKFALDGCRNGRVYYCLGTKYARVLKYFSGIVQNSRNVTTLEARKVVGAAIIKTLPLFKDALLNLKAQEYFEPIQFLVLLQNSVADLQPNEKQALQDIIKKSESLSAKANGKSLRPQGIEVLVDGKIPVPVALPTLGDKK